MKLSDKICEELLRRIQSEYKPGQRLPNEISLASEFQVSRATMREAIQQLVNQKYLEVKRGCGTYVIEQSKEDTSCCELEKMRWEQLNELRLILEPQIAAKAAERASDKEIHEIQKIEGILEKSMYESADSSKENKRFHKQIAKASHNEFAIAVISMIQEEIFQQFSTKKADCMDHKPLKKREEMENKEDMKNDHQMIVRYLKMRDAEGVRQAMNMHIRHAMNNRNQNKE